MIQNKIAVYRAEQGWTLEELAKKVGVSRQTIVEVENNAYDPPFLLVFKIAAAFDKIVPEVFSYHPD